MFRLRTFEEPVSLFAPHQHRRAGFTLTEIMVVLLIICVLSTVSFYVYANSRKDQEVLASAEKIRSVLSYARTRAISNSQGLNTAVTFDLTNQEVWVDDMVDLGDFVRTPKVFGLADWPPDVRITAITIGTNTFTSARHRVYFKPDGTCPFTIIDLINVHAPGNAYQIRMVPNSADTQLIGKSSSQ